MLYCSLSLFSHILLDTGPRCPLVIIFLYFILQQNALLSIFSSSHWDYPSCNLSLDIKVNLISSSYQSYVHSIISDQLPLPFLLLHSFVSITSLYPGMTVKPGSVPSIVDHYLLCHPCFLASNKSSLLPFNTFLAHDCSLYFSTLFA